MRKTSQKFSQSRMLCKVALVAFMLAFQAMNLSLVQVSWYREQRTVL